jgi:DNA-binding transcriptional regulator YiaG
MRTITTSGSSVPVTRPWNGWEAGTLRDQMKVSQELFGSLFGVTAKTVRRWEKEGAKYIFASLAHRHLLDSLHDLLKEDRKTGRL